LSLVLGRGSVGNVGLPKSSLTSPGALPCPSVSVALLSIPNRIEYHILGLGFKKTILWRNEDFRTVPVGDKGFPNSSLAPPQTPGPPFFFSFVLVILLSIPESNKTPYFRFRVHENDHAKQTLLK
jgi:hypothetical protein